MKTVIIAISLLAGVALYSYPHLGSEVTGPFDGSVTSKIRRDASHDNLSVVFGVFYSEGLLSEESLFGSLESYLPGITPAKDRSKHTVRFAPGSFSMGTYENRDGSITCVNRAEFHIKLFRPDGSRYSTLFISVQIDETIDTPDEYPATRDRLVPLTLNAFIAKLDANDTWQRFLSESYPERGAVNDSENTWESRTANYRALHERNKKEYRHLLNLSYSSIRGGSIIGLSESGINTDWEVMGLGMEWFIHEKFSIDYGFRMLTFLLSMIPVSSDPGFSFSMNHDLLFRFNPIQKALFSPSVYLQTGYGMIFTYSSLGIAGLSVLNISKLVPWNGNTATIHSFRLGIGFDLTTTSPYASRQQVQVGMQVYYQPILLHGTNRWWHTLGIAMTVPVKWSVHVYREKPHKLVMKRNFRTM
jgi:hypothetical protein